LEAPASSGLLKTLKTKGKPQKVSPGQTSLWDEWDAPLEEIEAVAKTFVVANALNPEIAKNQFSSSKIYSEEEFQKMGRCQVSDPPLEFAAIGSTRQRGADGGFAASSFPGLRAAKSLEHRNSASWFLACAPQVVL
jgi:hypothetical protein